MGTRIASVWTKDDDKNPGQKKRTGIMRSDSGINLPAGMEIGVSIVANKDKVAGDNKPDHFIEVWPRTDRNITDSGSVDF